VLYLGSVISMSTGTPRTGVAGGTQGAWTPHQGIEEPVPRAKVALVGGRSLTPSVASSIPGNVDGKAPVKGTELSGSS
jgi:hypothetical protein